MSEQPQISVEEMLKAETDIVLEDLEGECSRHASKVAFWSYQNSLTKDRCKRAEAMVNLSARMNPPAGVKVTEGAIDSIVTLDPAVVVCREELAKSDAAVHAFDHRRDMLKALCQLRLIEARNAGDIRPLNS